jgi:ATP phosphoribosyltransferase
VSQLTIAIPRGRLESETLAVLASVGLSISQDRDSRALVRTDETGQHRFIFVKPVDVPVYVEHGIADCGVVGRDVLLETRADLLQPIDLRYGACRIAIAALADKPENDHAMVRVATKYPNLAAHYFGTRGRPVEIIEVSGSVELAPVLGLADYILDLVQTGRTLKENGLQIVDVITESAAQLVVNRASYQLKAGIIAQLISRLKCVITKPAK